MAEFAAELRKLWTVRTTWVLSAVGWALVAVSTAMALFNEQFRGGPFTGSDAQVRAALDQIGASAPLVLVIALLAMTTEFRHGTIGRTLQLTPRRLHVLIVKLAAGVTYAFAYFVTTLMVVAAAVAIAAAVHGQSVSLGAETVTGLWQGLVGLSLNAVLGVAIGALLRSQVVAITVTLVWLFVAESLINTLVPAVGRWLPFQTLNALFLSEETLAARPEGMMAPLDPPLALATFLGYVLIATLAAGVVLRVRDV